VHKELANDIRLLFERAHILEGKKLKYVRLPRGDDGLSFVDDISLNAIDANAMKLDPFKADK